MSSKSPANQNAGASLPNPAFALRNCFKGALLTVKRDGQITSCTPAAQKALHLKSGHAALPASLRSIVEECFASNEPVPTRVLAPSSRKAALAATAVPVRRGRATEVVVVLHDFSPLHQFEDHLRHIDRLASIGTLSASMGHEIKNALVAVKTFVDLLLEKNPDSELAEVVRREMCRIDSIVSQMLRFAGPGQPTFSALHLHDLLEHSLRLVQHPLERKLISLNRSFKAAPDSITGDDYQLEQAFVNLFLNAVEAMEAHGSLTVATEFVKPAPAKAAQSDRNSQPQVRVTISDTGTGIVPENMKRLFDPFFTTKHHGTGLGLPITRRIFQEHDGDISVQSEVNKGTTFSIMLPARAHAH